MQLSKDALDLLMDICKKAKFNPFPDTPVAWNMTKEELIERNKSIVNVKAAAANAISMPNFEELEKMYNPDNYEHSLTNFINRLHPKESK
jgi:hypothetical protein